MVELQDYTVEFTGSIRAQSLSDAYCMLRRIIDNQSLAQTFKIVQVIPNREFVCPCEMRFNNEKDWLAHRCEHKKSDYGA